MSSKHSRNNRGVSGVSRRQFLQGTAALAGGSLLPTANGSPDKKSLAMPPGVPRSRVVHGQDPRVISGPRVHRAMLDELFEKSLAALTRKQTSRDAWRSILMPDDVIGLKFNQSGQAVISTTPTLVDVLISSLVQAGFSAKQIVCVEAPEGTAKKHGTTLPNRGYSTKVTDFASGEDQFASVLDQITALIDVPFLKVHNIAGMTGALKNLSHGLIKHPGRYHANGCSPYIADIVSATPIRSKLRLCIVDALRVAYVGSPEPTASTLHDSGSLLLSFDPVAADTTGFAVLNDIRRTHKIEPIAKFAAEIPFLAAAHERGVGVAVWHGIDLERVRP